MKVPFFTPWITDSDKKSVLKVLNQRWLTDGPALKKFENLFSKFIESKYSVGCSSATHALHLSLKSLGIGKNDQVIVPTMTFSATSDVVRYCGAEPILIDVDMDTFNILPEKIEEKITNKTKSIIVVHYGGQSCDMDKIMKLSKKYGLQIIEDCAHALGSTYKNVKCGNIGKAGCFSFYPTKIITTGEGGMITTNDNSLQLKSRLLRSHGMDKTPSIREGKALWKYDIIEMGYNYRLDEIRSSLGLSQLKRVNQINKMRIKIAKKYNQSLQTIKGITIPKIKKDRNHIYHLYSIKVEDSYKLSRNELFKKLSQKGIGTSVQFYPLHLMSYNNTKYKNKKNEFTNSNKLKNQLLSLPIYPTMKEKQVNYVISCLK